MQRTRFAPDIISGHRQTVVIFDAALQDERLLDLRVFVKGYARAGFEPEEASHLAALGILVEHLDRDFFRSGSAFGLDLDCSDTSVYNPDIKRRFSLTIALTLQYNYMINP